MVTPNIAARHHAVSSSPSPSHSSSRQLSTASTPRWSSPRLAEKVAALKKSNSAVRFSTTSNAKLSSTGSSSQWPPRSQGSRRGTLLGQDFHKEVPVIDTHGPQQRGGSISSLSHSTRPSSGTKRRNPRTKEKSSAVKRRQTTSTTNQLKNKYSQHDDDNNNDDLHDDDKDADYVAKPHPK